MFARELAVLVVGESFWFIWSCRWIASGLDSF